MSKTVKLNNGIDHPLLGYGTYKVGVVPASASAAAKVTRTTDEVLKDALDVGYRMFDCAEFYGNEAGVGAALTASGIAREELFLVSKVWCDTIYKGPEAVRAQVEKCLKDLGTTYIDLFLVHWPVPGKHVEAYKELEKMVNEKKLKSIGLSNYSIEDYQELKPHVTIKPVVNQIEINPFLFRKNTIQFFKAEGIVMHSYRTLRQGKEMANDVITGIAKKHSKTSAQILGRWCVQQEMVYIPKSEKKERMIENATVFDFELDSEDMDKLSGMTTPEAIAEYKKLYVKCIVRDTPIQDSGEGIKQDITLD